MEVRVTDAAEVGVVGDALRLARLHQGDGFYPVAWHRDEPAGHLHLALTNCKTFTQGDITAGAAWLRF